MSDPRTERSLEGSAPNLLRRVIQLRRRVPPSPRVADQPTAVEARVEALEGRLGHLEAAVEGLQDSVHRQAVRHDRALHDLQRRSEPSEIRRELNADARRRGL